MGDPMVVEKAPDRLIRGLGHLTITETQTDRSIQQLLALFVVEADLDQRFSARRVCREPSDGVPTAESDPLGVGHRRGGHS